MSANLTIQNDSLTESIFKWQVFYNNNFQHFYFSFNAFCFGTVSLQWLTCFSHFVDLLDTTMMQQVKLIGIYLKCMAFALIY